MNDDSSRTPEETPASQAAAESAEANEALEQSQAESDCEAEGAAALEEQLKAAIAERDANLEQCRRAQAELENYRRRVQKEMEQARRYEGLSLIRDILPGLDNLQRAIVASEKTSSIEELAQGVRMVLGQIEEVLGRHSAVPIQSTGKPFDPNRHEALQQLPSDDVPAMTVMQELERGYVMHDRVVRPSKVIVSSGPPAE